MSYLLPKTPAGAVIVMDNASFHKRHDMLEAISANQCKAEFLPPYSPDLNPIEHKWAQAKAVRRRYRCGIDELFSEHSQYVFYNDLAIESFNLAFSVLCWFLCEKALARCSNVLQILN